MKKTTKGIKMILTGMAGAILGCATIVGANQAIQAIQNTEVKVYLNGRNQVFKDETTGEMQYPITYNDRTYLPLRNIANLAGLSVDYDNDTKSVILNNKYNNYLDAYTSLINKLIFEYGNNYITYKLVYFNNDDIPDLMYGHDGYWTAIASFKNGEVKLPFGEQGIGYGISGRSGFTFDEKSGMIVDSDSDYAGGIMTTSYTFFDDDYNGKSIYSRLLGAFDENFANNEELTAEEKSWQQEILDDYNRYGGYYGFDGQKISEEEFSKILSEHVNKGGKTIDCFTSKSAAEIYSELIDLYDEQSRNLYVDQLLDVAYNGKKEITENGKTHSVYDFVHDFTADHFNDVLKVETNDIKLYFYEDGEMKVGSLRDKTELEGTIISVYFKSLALTSSMYDETIYVVTENQKSDKTELNLNVLSSDVNRNFYVYNKYTKETNKADGTIRYYNSRPQDESITEMTKEDFDFIVKQSTTVPDDGKSFVTELY